ncbi:MAG: transposase, partial [Thiomicrospira sp.]|uniref:REP-associated tyrosine transposase n=1 Tax=Thiomicrospira sp. TaxID=935 RepID=UPI0019EA21F0
MQYRRVKHLGGTFFFTLVTAQRRSVFNNPISINLLRQAIRQVKSKHPFQIDAFVLLPDHLHAIWTLPENDTDYSMRWRLIKTWYVKNGIEKNVWQPRFWEHTIRDEQDFNRHLDYIHYNPLKHGYVNRVKDWPYSSFHKHVAQGFYDLEWGNTEPDFSLIDKRS